MMVLRNLDNTGRDRIGCNLINAKSVGLLYLERDHEHYRTIKNLARHLREDLGIKKVSMMSFVDNDSKSTPGWLVKKLDSGYFCKSDLNWFGKPIKEIESFIDYEFDILLDLEFVPVLPLKHVLIRSKAKMKVVADQPDWPIVDYDLQVVRRKDHDSSNVNNEESDSVISHEDNCMEHVKMTLELLSKINIQ